MKKLQSLLAYLSWSNENDHTALVEEELSVLLQTIKPDVDTVIMLLNMGRGIEALDMMARWDDAEEYEVSQNPAGYLDITHVAPKDQARIFWMVMDESIRQAKTMDVLLYQACAEAVKKSKNMDIATESFSRWPSKDVLDFLYYGMIEEQTERKFMQKILDLAIQESKTESIEFFALTHFRPYNVYYLLKQGHCFSLSYEKKKHKTHYSDWDGLLRQSLTGHGRMYLQKILPSQSEIEGLDDMTIFMRLKALSREQS